MRPELRFDRVDLFLHAADVAFEYGLQVGDVFFRRHVLHDVREHVAEFVESDLLGHAGIVRGGWDCANRSSGMSRRSARILDEERTEIGCAVHAKWKGKRARILEAALLLRGFALRWFGDC